MFRLSFVLLVLALLFGFFVAQSCHAQGSTGYNVAVSSYGSAGYAMTQPQTILRGYRRAAVVQQSYGSNGSQANYGSNGHGYARVAPLLRLRRPVLLVN